MPKLTPLDRMVLRVYDLTWKIVLPILKRNSRLAEGMRQRLNGPSDVKGPIDIWIQAASAGEAYLATSLAAKLAAIPAIKILLTTNTRQGFDILHAAVSKNQSEKVQLTATYLPFDRPGNMVNIVKRLQPKVTVLLETEIWPGLLAALKENELPALILNGRISPKSLRRYLLYPSMFRAVAPQHISAISVSDAQRFRRLFPSASVDMMPNIKFDRIQFPSKKDGTQNHLTRLFGSVPDLLVLGSVREEEEDPVEKIIAHLLMQLPHVRIALFPRHMHRLTRWQHIFGRNGWTWQFRSKATGPIPPGSIMLWDTFGELSTAYALSKTVFVGGTLARLGGQNFLEPLAYGVRPVIGPSWENFYWVGENIFSQQLVQRCDDWQTVATALIQNMKKPVDPSQLKARAKAYVYRRQGGTLQAFDCIRQLLTCKETHHRYSKLP